MTTLINSIDQTINFNEQTIRILGSYDNPLFVAIDICKILGLKNVTDTLRSLPDKWKQIADLENSEVTFSGRNGVRKIQGLNCINEAGLYKLIMRSNKPIAQKFQEVVCEEILPSLRKKGEYKIQSIIEKNKKLEEEKLRLEEDKKLKDKEIKQLHTLVKKKARKRYSYSHSVYIISNPDIKNHYKIGITEDRNKRLEALGPGAPRPYNIEYSRELHNVREEVSMENLLLGIFDKYRVETDTRGGKQREWIKNIKIDVLKNEMDNLVNYYQNRREYFDTEYLKIENINEEGEDTNESDYEEIEDEGVEDEGIEDEGIEDEGDYEETTDFKVCYVCNEEKPLTEYYNKLENVDGKEGSCKKCYSKYKKQLKEEKDAREIIVRLEGTKKCRTCLEIKEFKNFAKHGTSKDGYGYECIDCKNIKNDKVETKRCNKCRITKNINEYNKFRLGYTHDCKECQNKNASSIKEQEDIKCCSNCKEQLSIDNFNKSKTSYDGYSNYCRNCAKEKKKEYTEKMKIEDKPDIINKTCNNCKLKKDVEHFLKKTETKDGFSNKCKECIKQINIVRRTSIIS